MDVLWMLFHISAVVLPSSISRIASMFGCLNVWLLKSLNAGGQPFLHASQQNTRTEILTTCVQSSTCMYVMNLLSTWSFSLLPAGVSTAFLVKISGQTSSYFFHASTMPSGSVCQGFKVWSAMTVSSTFTKCLRAGLLVKVVTLYEKAFNPSS